MSFLKKIDFIYLFYFLPAVGLRCCAWAFFSCGERELLFICGAWASHCGGFSCCEAEAVCIRASVVVVHGLSCPMACGIFWDQGLNPDLLHWQADSLPLSHQRSPQNALSADKMVPPMPWSSEEGVVTGSWSGPGDLCGVCKKPGRTWVSRASWQRCSQWREEDTQLFCFL